MKKRNKKHPKSLGFIFSYQQSNTVRQHDGISITVTTVTDISEHYPSRYQHERDFEVLEIIEGQTSPLYIEPNVFLNAYHKEIISFQNNADFAQECYESVRYLFSIPIAFEQYCALHSFSMAHLHMPYLTQWETSTILEDTLHEAMGSLFPLINDITSIYKNYQSVAEYSYHRNIHDTLSL